MREKIRPYASLHDHEITETRESLESERNRLADERISPQTTDRITRIGEQLVELRTELLLRHGW